jgi:hypothetical protein
MLPFSEFGRTSHRSSRVIFGAAALGGMSESRAIKTLDLVASYGVNHIDTAAMYGSSEDHRIVLVKVSATDVVSIPTDYNNMKGRACKYQIYKEIEVPEELKYRSAVYDFEEDDYEGYDEDYDDDEEDEEDVRADVIEAVADVLVEHGWSEEEVNSLVAMADAIYNHVTDGGSVTIRN